MASNEIRHRARLVTNLRRNPAGRGQRDAPRPGLPQPHRQCRPGDARRAGGRQRDSAAPRPGPMRRHGRDRGRRHRCRHPAEKLARIFDPFFTTKPAGVGTGLGLAICHRIITELGGAITVASEIGKGTTFRVDLPVAADMSVAQERGADRAPTSSHPRPQARQHPRRRRRGLACSRPSAAYSRPPRGDRDHVRHPKRWASSVRPAFDLILSDLMMPEMTGWDLHARLVEIAPDQADA